MTLDARQRSSLYEKLVSLIGEDDANAMMSNFPETEGSELVTKDFLRAELAERFQRQTAWTVATMVAMTGVFSAIVGLT